MEAVRAPRIHHQLMPMYLEYEDGFKQQIIDGLSKMGHEMHKSVPDGFSALTAIGRNGGQCSPVFDQRRGGSTAVF